MPLQRVSYTLTPSAQGFVVSFCLVLLSGVNSEKLILFRFGTARLAEFFFLLGPYPPLEATIPLLPHTHNEKGRIACSTCRYDPHGKWRSHNALLQRLIQLLASCHQVGLFIGNLICGNISWQPHWWIFIAKPIDASLCKVNSLYTSLFKLNLVCAICIFHRL